MTSRPVRVLVAPRDVNPYQSMLYGALERDGVESRYWEGPTGSRTVDLLLAPFVLVVRRLAGCRILHIHWVYTFIFPWGGESTAVRRVARWWFTIWLSTARALGYRIVWTAHNLLPHARVFDDDVRGRRALLRRCDGVIAHSEAAVAPLRALGARTIKIIPIGSLVDGLPDTITRAEAREHLGIDPDATVFAQVGYLEPYKGADVLLEAVAGLRTDRPVVALLAGECKDREFRDRLSALGAAPGVRLHMGYVADADVQIFMRAADFAVFPFRRVTTTSSVMLALAFDVPVIIPDLAELESIPDAVSLRCASDASGLAATLERAIMMGPDSRGDMRRSAAAYTRRVTPHWDTVAGLTRELYDAVLGAAPASRSGAPVTR